MRSACKLLSTVFNGIGFLGNFILKIAFINYLHISLNYTYFKELLNLKLQSHGNKVLQETMLTKNGVESESGYIVYGNILCEEINFSSEMTLP